MRKQTKVIAARISLEKYERLKVMVAHQRSTVGSFLKFLLNDYLQKKTPISFL